MTMILRRTSILVLFVFLFGLALMASAQQQKQVKAKLSPSEVEKIAKEAYILGYPLVLMDVTRQVGTACPSSTAMCAPLNQFAHVPVFRTIPSPMW